MSLRHSPILCFVLFAASLFAQQDQGKTTTTFYPAKPLPGVTPSPQTAPMPGAAPLFIQGDGFDSSLVVVNDASVNAGATITLRDLEGHQLVQKRIVLEKSSRFSIAVSSLLEHVESPPILGSLSVLQDAKVAGMVIAAQLTIQDERNSTPAYIDEELGMPAMDGSSTLRGVADPAEGPALLAITNLESSTQHITLRCLREKTENASVSITIAAYATSVSPGCSDKSIDSVADYMNDLDASKQRGVQAFEIVGDGMPGMLAAFALAPHRHHESRVLSAVPFVDPKSLMSQNTVYVGVPVGAQSVLSDGIYVPRIALVNFSSQVAHITVEASSSGPQAPEDGTKGTDIVTPSVLHVLLKAGESKGVLIDAGMGDSGLQHSVIVKSDLPPGQVQSKLVSRSDGPLYEVEMLAKDEKITQNGGGHPWLTSDGTESHLLLFNHSASVKTVAVTIANGLTMWKRLYRIAALDTRQLSINQIIHDQVKDDSGKTLDPKYQDGVVLWSVANPGDVTGRLLVSNRASAMAHNFSCGNFVVICGGMNLSVFNSGFIPINGFTGYADAVPECCYAWGPGQCGGTQTSCSASYSWSLGNTGIVNFNAPYDQSSPTPNLKGVASGSTWASVNVVENGCSSSGSGSPPPAVVPCPTTLTHTKSLPQPLAPLVPGILTGVGIIAVMAVGPSTQNFDGAILTETWGAPKSNSCPASFGDPCAGSGGTFMVGLADGNGTVDGQPTPATQNVFYDNHTTVSTGDLLTQANLTSCSATCTQTFSCGGKPLGGSFTVTRSFTEGVVGPSAVTNVNVTKAP
jgi:hypothetical protein